MLSKNGATESRAVNAVPFVVLVRLVSSGDGVRSVLSGIGADGAAARAIEFGQQIFGMHGLQEQFEVVAHFMRCFKKIG
jgi:hypothetical protein